MPGAIFTFLFTAAVASAGGAAIGAALTTAFLVTAGTYIAAELAGKPKRNPPTLHERKSLVRLAAPARKVIYGETTFAPAPFAIQSFGDRVVMACAIADHSVEAIREVIIDGGRYLSEAECVTLTTNGTLTITGSTSTADLSDKRVETASYASSASLPFLMKVHAGLDGSGNFADKMAEYSVPVMGGLGSWTASKMKGTGLSWIVFEFPRTTDPTKFPAWQALPQIQIRVKRGDEDLAAFPGSDLLSPDNPAWCLYDFVTKYTAYGEEVFGDGRIDIASFQSTAARCQARGWNCSGVLDLNTAPDGSIEAIAQSAISAAVCDIGGRIYFKHRNSPAPTTPCFGENNIVYWSIVPFAPRDERRSGVSVEYVRYDNATGLETIETASLINPAARAELGDVKQEIPTAMVSNREQALLVGQAVLAREHDSYIFEAHFNASGVVLTPHDLFELQLPDLGLQSKYFRVLSVEMTPGFLVKITAIEEPINLVEDIDFHAQEFIPALHPNYHHTGKLRHSYDGGGEIKINTDDRVKIIYQ